MWSYYGAKTNIIDLYPRATCDKIIEPFCGTARYALRHFDREVWINDKYEVIYKIWKWLQKCSPGDITGLPRFEQGDNINDVTYDCEEARLLTGFLVGFGFTGPRDTATPRLRNRPNAMNHTIKMISSQLFKIRHWTVTNLSYEEMPNEIASWFVDPPYQAGGHAYVKSNKHIDFTHLGQWSMDRQGQVIVCENMKATWLPFQPITVQTVYNTHKNGGKGKYEEAMWTNQKASYLGQQLQIV